MTGRPLADGDGFAAGSLANDTTPGDDWFDEELSWEQALNAPTHSVSATVAQSFSGMAKDRGAPVWVTGQPPVSRLSEI
ncbi:hypothetical protein KRMM14A1259_05810 [Krasilnikovia sp. MM14-A1259]